MQRSDSAGEAEQEPSSVAICETAYIVAPNRAVAENVFYRFNDRAYVEALGKTTYTLDLFPAKKVPNCRREFRLLQQVGTAMKIRVRQEKWIQS